MIARGVSRLALRIAPYAWLAAATLVGGCGAFRPAKVPMAVYAHPSVCTDKADTLLLMLPGAYSEPQEFVDEGFLAALDERRLAVDTLRVDAHIGYYNRGTFFTRLHDDVIAPAKARGYRSVWVVGISLGGLGAIAYSDQRPGELNGIVALSPYLGERLIGTEIDNAGGLMRWAVPAEPLSNDQRLWRRLQRYGTTPGASDLVPLWLGYGTEDRFAFSHRLLAAVLPPSRVFTTPGGHDWPEWRRLWRSVLPTLPLPSCQG